MKNEKQCHIEWFLLESEKKLYRDGIVNEKLLLITNY